MSYARRVTELEEENAALKDTIDRLWTCLRTMHRKAWPKRHDVIMERAFAEYRIRDIEHTLGLESK